MLQPWQISLIDSDLTNTEKSMAIVPATPALLEIARIRLAGGEPNPPQ